MIASLLAVFLLGLRHGADPDHLAAIDNLTRRITVERPGTSKFVGTLFAAGHTLMVLGLAGAIGAVGRHLGAFGSGLERAGTWLSIAILIAMAALNVRRLLSSSGAAPTGIRTRLLRPLFRESKTVLVALPIGFLFGLGFETSSQIAAYVMVAAGGLGNALWIGVAFCAGMILTDTCDSVLVSSLVRSGKGARASRAWLWTMTVAASGVAFFQLLQLAGTPLAVPELILSAAIVAAPIAVYALLLRERVDVAADAERRHEDIGLNRLQVFRAVENARADGRADRAGGRNRGDGSDIHEPLVRGPA